MDLNDTPEQAEYRARVRAWLEQHADEAPKITRDDIDAGGHRRPPRVAAQARRGRASSASRGRRSTAARASARSSRSSSTRRSRGRSVPGILDVIGVGMLGPTLIAHGTEEQKQRYLGPMLHGDEVWCQLFSEPAAGSDLAGIQSRAKQQDDGTWRVSGQKVWTTNAQFASYGLLLARTDPDVPKHKGLTMFVVPMDAEGVTVRPLRQISRRGRTSTRSSSTTSRSTTTRSSARSTAAGASALTTLMFERVAIGLGGEGFGWRADRFAERAAADERRRRATRRSRPASARSRPSSSRCASPATGMLSLQRGQCPAPRARWARSPRSRPRSRRPTSSSTPSAPTRWTTPVGRAGLRLPGLKSAGGTEEILRNMVGERVLVGKEQERLSGLHRCDMQISALPDHISGDPALIEQALGIVIGNALRYSPEHNHVTVIGVASDKSVTITIEDLGIGIPERDLPFVGQPFFRAANTGHITGTGLGPYLARHIVSLHGGRLSIDRHRRQGNHRSGFASSRERLTVTQAARGCSGNR